MRRSGRGCYEISGTVVRQVTDAAPTGDSVAAWEARRDDLQSESSAIAQLRHTLTAEENGLWNAIQRELTAVDAAIDRSTRTGDRS